ncbi:MAG TPA: GntR family transcriptional regulator, partial [Casimicrobiaceae bacterium]|nr:GntR family transcriptional regulator [Casimicrobiaceae bacterium]
MPNAAERSRARDATETLALVRSSSLPMLAQREIERMILSGELAVGSKLNEAGVAEMLGVSRGPVREAFRA